MTLPCRDEESFLRPASPGVYRSIWLTQFEPIPAFGGGRIMRSPRLVEGRCREALPIRGAKGCRNSGARQRGSPRERTIGTEIVSAVRRARRPTLQQWSADAAFPEIELGARAPLPSPAHLPSAARVGRLRLSVFPLTDQVTPDMSGTYPRRAAGTVAKSD